MSTSQVTIPEVINSQFLLMTQALYRNDNSLESELSKQAFGFKNIFRSHYDPSLTVNTFLLHLLPALKFRLPFALAEKLCITLNAEPSTSSPRSHTYLQPLNAVNTAKITDSQYLLWSIFCFPNHQSSIELVILDTATNSAHISSADRAWKYSSFQILHRIFTATHSLFKLRNPQDRIATLHDLAVSADLAHVTDRHPTHIGHYIQNNIGHLSRLEQLNLTAYFSAIYRTSFYDYFDNEDMLFSSSTQELIRIPETLANNPGESHPSLQLIKFALADGFSVICSKDYALSGNLWRTIREHLESEISPKRTFSLCVGIRGGSREALNLITVVKHLARTIHEQTRCNVHLVLDGMSESKHNNSTSTYLLSDSKEQKISETFLAEFSSINYVTIESVVGLPLGRQLKAISKCLLSFDHQGSSTIKHMYLSGMDVITHGHDNRNFFIYSSYCVDESWKPLQYHMGINYIKAKEEIPGENDENPPQIISSRANYILDEEKCVDYFSNFDFKAYLQASSQSSISRRLLRLNPRPASPQTSTNLPRSQ